MPGMCNSTYEPTNGMDGRDKMGSKNLFKTVLAKLTRKHKKKASNENVYEAIEIYKDNTDLSINSSGNGQRQDIEINNIKEIPTKDKNGSKNLFKTALAKLTRNHKEKKATNDNVYEVIVIHKDRHEDNASTDLSITSSRDEMCQDIQIKNNNIKEKPPKAPPRSRSRSNSRNSCQTFKFENQEPIRPARSRRSLSRSSCNNFSPPPTPPPRSRPQSRNSCKNLLLEDNKRSCHHTSMQNDPRKPPIAPPRSPFRKKINQLAEKNTFDNKPVLTVSLADLETGLDYADIEDIEDYNENIKDATISPTSKLHSYDDLVACSARVDSRWARVINSSNFSLGMPGGGADCVVDSLGWSASHGMQACSGLAGNQLDMCRVPENNLEQLAPNGHGKQMETEEKN